MTNAHMEDWRGGKWSKTEKVKGRLEAEEIINNKLDYSSWETANEGRDSRLRGLHQP